ncbi:hypothetical protein Avbf_00721 [Armadillidium vulgare]|nr:hypothetical protein Avbf_00721 [Armadillidium vulgare]
MYSEDEWSQVKRRFGTEGLNWESTTPNQKSLQLFRWLVDAEDNLKTARKINEKLRKQHEEEKKLDLSTLKLNMMRKKRSVLI